MKGKQWIMAKHFAGHPKKTDLKMTDLDIPEVKHGEVLFENEIGSVDPFTGDYMTNLPEGSTMAGYQLSRVIESRHPDFVVGDYYSTHYGWCTHFVYNPDTYQCPHPVFKPKKLVDLSPLPWTIHLGPLGITGLSAYFGLIKICEIKPGDVVLISSAAGGVGSIAGQIAKIKGCKVIGLTGTDEKVAWLYDLGFDFAFNYKNCDIDGSLKDAAPEGIHCYFDNVGGEISSLVIENHMKMFGRVAVCGSISAYFTNEPPLGRHPWKSILVKQLKIEGFMTARWFEEFENAIKEITAWLKHGDLKYKEYTVKGFEQMGDALDMLLNGDNMGKMLIRN